MVNSKVRNDVNIGDVTNKGFNAKDGVDTDVGDNANERSQVNKRQLCEHRNQVNDGILEEKKVMMMKNLQY